MNALYRPRPHADWQDVRVIGPHASGKVVVREVGPLLPGVFLVDYNHLRVPVVCQRGLRLVDLLDAGETLL